MVITSFNISGHDIQWNNITYTARLTRCDEYDARNFLGRHDAAGKVRIGSSPSESSRPSTSMVTAFALLLVEL